jgi:hypothetical protein
LARQHRSKGNAIDQREDGIRIVQRRKFHQLVKEAFELYLQELRDRSNPEQCRNFVKKMGFICQLSAVE